MRHFLILIAMSGCVTVNTRPPDTFPVVAVYPELAGKNAHIGTTFPIRNCAGECKFLTARHLIDPGNVGVLVQGVTIPVSDDPADFDPRHGDARTQTSVNDWMKLPVPMELEVDPVETVVDAVPPFGTRSVIVGYPKLSETIVAKEYWKQAPVIIRCRVIEPERETQEGVLALVEYYGGPPPKRDGFSGAPVAILNADGSIGPVWGIFIGETEETVYKASLPPLDFIVIPVKKTVGVVVPLRKEMM